MAITPQLIKKVNELLIKSYGKDSVDYDVTKRKFTIGVEIPKNQEDRKYRIGILKNINQTLKDFGSVYTQPPGGKSGSVKLSGISIEVKKRITTEDNKVKKGGLKPSHIQPSIVNSWLSPEEIVENVSQYVKKQEYESDLENQILYLLNLTIKNANTLIPFKVKRGLVPAEFFEVLTSIKLGVLLRSNDGKIRKTLGIPSKMDLSKSKIKIYIPKSANFQLIDYYISISSFDKKDESNSLKISVKSKVSGDKVNTVKFGGKGGIFGNEKDVNDWYNSLATNTKQKEKGPKIIAESIMTGYKGYSRKSMGAAPLLSILNLLKEDRSKIINQIKTEFNKVDIEIFEKVLFVVCKNISTVKYTTPLDDLVGKLNLKQSDVDNVYSIIKLYVIMRGRKVPDKTVWNLAHFCEKILELSSTKDSQAKYDFYQMFFDEVLTKREIAYAVASRTENGIKYGFYSKINYKVEYNDWINLRTKNSANQPNDVIGMEA